MNAIKICRKDTSYQYRAVLTLPCLQPDYHKTLISFHYVKLCILEGELCLSFFIMDKLFIIPLSHGYPKPRAIWVMPRFEIKFHILVKKFSESVNNSWIYSIKCKVPSWAGVTLSGWQAGLCGCRLLHRPVNLYHFLGFI